MPMHQIAESPRRQLLRHCRGTYHAALGRAVESTQHRVGQPQRDRQARFQILRELRVIRGRKAQSAAHAVAPRAPAERALGGNVQRLRLERPDALCHGAPRQHGYPDLRIGRTGNGYEVARCDHPDFVAEAAQPGRRLRQCGHDAVGHREPGVGHDHDSRHVRLAPQISLVSLTFPRSRDDLMNHRQQFCEDRAAEH